MNDINTVIEFAESSVTAHGKQLTDSRRMILKALIHADRALSAYDLVDYCKQHFNQNIQPMSVYRVLEFLEAEHLAHKLNVSNKYTVCSRIFSEVERVDDHGISQFLTCTNCGKTSEKSIEPEMIHGLLTHANQEGFLITNPQIEIHCVCNECNKTLLSGCSSSV